MDYLDSVSDLDEPFGASLTLESPKPVSHSSEKKEKENKAAKDSFSFSGKVKEKKEAKKGFGKEKGDAGIISSSEFKELGAAKVKKKKSLPKTASKSDSPDVPSRRQESPLLFLRHLVLTAVILLGIWAVYGVTIQPNFAFCSEMIGPNAASALQRLAGTIGDLLCVVGSVYP